MVDREIIRIQTALYQFVEEHGLGKVLPAPCDVYFSRHDVVQPDILFIASDRLGIIKETYIQGAPDLLVEVISPAIRNGTVNSSESSMPGTECANIGL